MKGVLIVNLGSPEAPTPEKVKPYLEEFLMDKYVIDLPYLLRSMIVKGIILRTRPKKSAAAYKKIWWQEGSPLIVISKQTQALVQQKVDIPVALAMRYGQPSIALGIEELAQKGVTDILLLPMYPQYAMATTLTIEELAEKIIAEKYPQIKLTKFPPFYHREEYIDSLTTVISEFSKAQPFDHLLFSYHGIPERHLKKTDPTKKHSKIKIIDHQYCCNPQSEEAKTCYRTHCFETTRLVVEKLQLSQDKYSQSFQSRLGIDKWLEPFTVDAVEQLAKQGVKKLAVVTPAFVADCIETLEEIEMEAGKLFKEHGGESFHLIPCLNTHVQWIESLAQWINDWKQNQ